MLDGRIQANLRKKIRDSSTLESCCFMKASILDLIQEVKAVVFENNELELRDISQINALLLLLAHQDSNFDVEVKLKTF